MYQQETGDIYKGLKRKRSPSLDSLAKNDSTEWEFKWEGSDEIHGPYPQDHMVDWALNEFFDERMLYRKVGSMEFLQYNSSATFS
jgi:CD2 antigen cytoplasmic tail-binding protein 2